MPGSVRRRIPATIALLVTIVAGLLLRRVLDGTPAKVGGVALYGTMIYAVVLLVRPRTTSTIAAVTAAIICWLVEFAQLTPFPARAAADSTLARLLLGSTFQPPDLAAYLLGIALAVAVHRFHRPAGRVRPLSTIGPTTAKGPS